LEYAIGFIILLGVLIFVHEFGHFIVAKAVGVKVLKFSLGFPPSMISRKWGETEYVIAWVPLGGYVKLLGEDPESEEDIAPEDEQRTLSGKPVWAKMAVVAAGPIFNVLLAIILFTGAYMAGLPVPVSEVGEVMAEGRAKAAGVQSGDLITAIDGEKVWRWDDMRRLIQSKPEQEIILTVKRDAKEIRIPVTPKESDRKDVFGNPVGLIGVKPSGRTAELGPLASLNEGVRYTYFLTKLILETLVKLVSGEISAKALSGPITIVQASGESLKAGYTPFIFVIAFISINLAIINLLPIPILDGGHLLFYLIEAVIRRPVEGRVREIATQFGILFLIFIMLLVFYNDISRIVTKGWDLTPP
jgi:regulator of sigma E protease